MQLKNDAGQQQIQYVVNYSIIGFMLYIMLSQRIHESFDYSRSAKFCLVYKKNNSYHVYNVTHT